MQLRERVGRLLPQRLHHWLAESIAHRISFAAAGLSAAFVLVVGLLSFVLTLALVRDSTRAEVNSETALVEERLSRSLSVIATAVERLAQSSLVTNALVDSSGRFGYLEPHLREYRLPEDVPFVLGLTDHAGRLIAGNGTGIVLSKSAAWIRQQVEKNEPHAEIRPDAEQPRLLLAYPVIFPATGTPEGMMLLELPLVPLLQAATKGLPPGSVALTLRGDPLRLALGTPGLDTGGIMVDRPLVVPRPLVQLDLHVVAGRSWLQAYGPLLKLGLLYWLAAMAALLLALRLARMAARHVVAPLRELTEAAQRHRAGDVNPANFPVVGRDEVGQLGRALRDLMQQLHAERDLLEQRVAERTAELNDLAYIVRRTSNGVVVTDPQGRVEWVNEGFVRLSGYTLEELRGHKPGDLLQGVDTDPAVVRHMAMRFAAGEGFAVEVVNYHKDGTPYWVSIDVQPIHDEQGCIAKFVALESDITERKRVDQLKSEFVSVVSHELRTPLTAIRGALGLLGGGVVGSLPPAALDMVERALSNSERLTRLINDLLDIQKLESGKMQFELLDCALPDLIEEALAANRPYAARYKVDIRLEGPVTPLRVRVDAGRFQQVMANLLSNAAKFSPEGASVELSVRPVAGSRVEIRVRDHGAGIPQEFRPRIFQKFSQADSSNTRSKDGTGLGLSITKALVEGMGGHIGFETEVGQGTTFSVTLPQAAADTPTS